MHISRKLGATLGGLALLVTGACSQDLNVTNPDNPDIPRALATPADVQSLAVSSIHAWYIGSNQVDPWAMLEVTGDEVTMNYGNFGARFNNLEPRIPYHNSSADADIETTQVPWESWYAAIGEGNDVLTALQGGMTLPGGNDKYAALALFTQAASEMDVALVFDKGYYVDENTDLNSVALQPYQAVADSTLKRLDKLIALTAGKDWVWDSGEFPATGGMDAAKLNRIANTMAAELLALTPRTASDAAKVDWAKVLQYANNGITEDFQITGDGSKWWSDINGLFNTTNWTRVDMRLICQMAPALPCTYDPANNGGTSAYVLTGAHDARVQIDTSGDDASGADFIYSNGKVIGDPARGIFMQSPYMYQHDWDFNWYSANYSNGPMTYIAKAENDLLKAEALIRTGGDRQLAADLVNNTRVNKGQLTPLTPANTDAEFMKAITYERQVELYATNGYVFMYLRHVDQLQPGTVRHLPVPATELETIGLPVYTFGGAVEDPTGLDVYSNSTRPFTNALPLTWRAGPTKQLQLPNGRTMHIAPPVQFHRPSPVLF